MWMPQLQLHPEATMLSPVHHPGQLGTSCHYLGRPRRWPCPLVVPSGGRGLPLELQRGLLSLL